MDDRQGFRPEGHGEEGRPARRSAPPSWRYALRSQEFAFQNQAVHSLYGSQRRRDVGPTVIYISRHPPLDRLTHRRVQIMRDQDLNQSQSAGGFGFTLRDLLAIGFRHKRAFL